MLAEGLIDFNLGPRPIRRAQESVLDILAWGLTHAQHLATSLVETTQGARLPLSTLIDMADPTYSSHTNPSMCPL